MTTFITARLQAACNSYVGALDLGTADAHAHLVIYDVDDVALATISLQNPAFGDATLAAPSVATAAGLPIAFTGSAVGVAHHYEAQDRDRVKQWEGLCGLAGSGHSCIMNSLAVGVGQAGTVTSLVLRLANGTAET